MFIQINKTSIQAAVAWRLKQTHTMVLLAELVKNTPVGFLRGSRASWRSKLKFLMTDRKIDSKTVILAEL